MSIRFLIMSDTHDDAFPAPLPPADGILHCGDLTNAGGLANYQHAIANLVSLTAELKLVIAGNHDVSLDPKWWAANLNPGRDDPLEPQKAHRLFHVAHGIHLLDEGTHTFTLADGRSFTDRFGAGAGANFPIPEGVDIVMTHGPPLPISDRWQLDLGQAGEHCGCPKLWRAIERAKPAMHCFGHIHEGYGVQVMDWDKAATRGFGPWAFPGLHEDELEGSLTQTTVFLNAAVMGHGEGDRNAPWGFVADFGARRQAGS
ncbi:Ser/Thr protein phosphatase family protein [Podospora appendiculata]|uniref:Ser/Thr protein phosphatase family protein n=1 Tax=Podospora appendiculata TaxID=314037 RepID=A0AAE1CB18_9PEZI|nr:Ser/Thr protein phosphatase family protein [Podospora appendiculata]